MLREHNKTFPEIQPISEIDLQPIGNSINLNNLNKKIVNSIECQQQV